MSCTMAISVLALAAGALGGPGAQPNPWGRIAAVLDRADAIVIELKGQRAVRGGYVSSDNAEIVVWADGLERRLSRSQVVRVTKLSRTHRNGKLIGALIGGAIAGALTAREEDFEPWGKAALASMGAAAGAAVGWRAEGYRKREVIYAR